MRFCAVSPPRPPSPLGRADNYEPMLFSSRRLRESFSCGIFSAKIIDSWRPGRARIARRQASRLGHTLTLTWKWKAAASSAAGDSRAFTFRYGVSETRVKSAVRVTLRSASSAQTSCSRRASGRPTSARTARVRRRGVGGTHNTQHRSPRTRDIRTADRLMFNYVR